MGRGRKGKSGMSRNGGLGTDVDDDIFEPSGGSSPLPLRSNSSVERMLHGGDRNTTSRFLREAKTGSTVSYTETDSYDRSDTRTVTYTKTGPDTWKGKDDVGGRDYSNVNSQAVADMAGGRRENAKANLKW